MWDADRAWPRGHALFPPIILYICGRGTIAAEMHVHRQKEGHSGGEYVYEKYREYPIIDN